MKTLLLFPPGWDPTGPYLALPVLKSYLETKDIKVDIRDLNVEYFDTLLSERYMEMCYIKAHNNDGDEIMLQMLSNTSKCVEEAKQIMKSEKFFDLTSREFALSTIRNAFYIVGKAYPGVKINFNSIDFHYSINSTEEVMQSISDRYYNNFIEYFTEYSGLLDTINAEEYEYVGLSVTGNSQLIPTITLCKLIKKHCPKVKYIQLGGNFISRLASRFKNRHPFFVFIDFIILYNGEGPLSLLIKSLEKGEDIGHINNLIYKQKNGRIVKTKIVNDFILNDTTPNFDGFALEKYLTSSLVLPIYTSRSCPCKCTFCTITNATMGKYVPISIHTVYENILKLKAKYKINYFFFVDETFEIKRMSMLADRIIENRDFIYWYAETRFTSYLTEAAARHLKAGGCVKIEFGLESYNQRILDLMKKHIQQEWIEKNLINCLKAGISVHMFFMTGFPTETREEAINTYDFTNKILTLSKNKYNLLYSTRGFGPFMLEIGSEVFQNPESFCIKIKDVSKHEDLRLYRDYITSSGLSEVEAKNLVDEVNGKNPEKYKFEKNFRSKVIMPPELRLGETILFLDSLHNMNYNLNKGIYKIIPNVYKKYNILGWSGHITFSKQVNTVVIYKPEYSKIYQIPNLEFNEINDMILNNSLKSSNINTIYHINMLIYYDFIEIDGCDIEFVKKTNVMHNTTYKMIVNKKIDMNFFNEQYYIQSDVMGLITQMNTFSFKILDVFKNGVNVNEASNILLNAGILKNKESFELFIFMCIDGDILQILEE